MKLGWNLVRGEERGLCVMLAFSYFLIIASFTLSKIARDSLFLSELSARHLPVLYVGMAALSAVTAIALGRLTKSSAQKRLSYLLFATGFSLLLFALWFRSSEGAPAVAFYLWNGIIGLVLITEFWLLVNDQIDTRQARRLFGPIGAAGAAGGLLAAVSAASIGHLIDTLWFLIAAASLLFLAGLWVSRATLATQEVQPSKSQAPETKKTPEISWKDNAYIRLLAWLFLAAGITTGVVDYGFKTVLQGEFTDSGKIASVLGIFYSVQGLISIAAQMGLTGALLSRFGHRPAANALPAGILGGGLLALSLPAAGLSWALLGTRLFDLSMRFSISRTAWEFLYFPLADEVKSKAKRFIDMVINRLADAVAGLLLILLNLAGIGGLRQIVLLIVVLTSWWLVLERRLNKLYLLEVDRSLARLVPPKAEATTGLEDLQASPELIASLEHADDDRVLRTMMVLRQVDPSILLDRALILAKHDSIAIRTRFLAIVAAEGGDPSQFMLWGPSPGGGSTVSRDESAGLPESSDERVIIAAQAGSPAGRPDERDRLEELIDDANDDVRYTALRSTALAGDRHYVTKIINRLAEPRDRAAAHEALVLFGKRISGTLGDYLVDESVSMTTRHRLLSILSEIGGQDAAYSLFRAAAPGGDRRITGRALQALVAMQRQDQCLFLPESKLREYLDREIERDAQGILQGQTVRKIADPKVRLFLDRVIQERVDQGLEIIFRWLALLYPASRVLSAYRGLKSGQPKVRAQSIEYMDTLLSGDLNSVLIPLIEAPDDKELEQQVRSLAGLQSESLDATFRQLLLSGEPWLQVSGLYAIGKTESKSFMELAMDLQESHHQLVRETASWAIRRLS